MKPLEFTEDFIYPLKPYIPVDSIYRNKVENENRFVYFYQIENLAKAFDDEFSWEEK